MTTPGHEDGRRAPRAGPPPPRARPPPRGWLPTPLLGLTPPSLPGGGLPRGGGSGGTTRGGTTQRPPPPRGSWSPSAPPGEVRRGGSTPPLSNRHITSNIQHLNPSRKCHGASGSVTARSTPAAAFGSSEESPDGSTDAGEERTHDRPQDPPDASAAAWIGLGRNRPEQPRQRRTARHTAGRRPTPSAAGDEHGHSDRASRATDRAAAATGEPEGEETSASAAPAGTAP